MTTESVNVTISGAAGQGLLVRDVRADRTVADLTWDVRQLTAERRSVTAIHELAHVALTQLDINQTGLTALSDACALLQQFARPLAVKRPSSLFGTATAPAVDLACLPHAPHEFGLPPWNTRALSRVFLQAPAPPASPFQRVMVKTASPDQTLLRFIAQLIADLAAALVRMIDHMLAAVQVTLARLVAALARDSNLRGFAIVILAVCRRYGRRSEPDDHAVLPTRRYPTSWGAIAYA